MRPSLLLACLAPLAAACGGAAAPGAPPGAQGVCALPSAASPPAESGACLGGNLAARVQAYAAGGGQALCQ